MKKWDKSIKYTFDNLFWYLLYLLPVICFMIRGGESTFLSFLEDIGFSLTNSNIVFSTMSDIFGANGIIPFFESSSIIAIVSYFVCVFIVHILVDVLLFIPRWSHKFLGKVYCDEDE